MVIDKVCEIVTDSCNGEVQPDSTFESLNIDSLEFLNVILSVEKEFNIKIPDSDRLSIICPADLAHEVEKRV